MSIGRTKTQQSSENKDFSFRLFLTQGNEENPLKLGNWKTHASVLFPGNNLEAHFVKL